MVIASPEYVNGREIILIANDLTHLTGSFGPPEYYLFDAASKLARKRKVPRVFNVFIRIFQSQINIFRYIFRVIAVPE